MFVLPNVYAKPLLRACLLLTSLLASLVSGSLAAWDATGHRLSAYVAWEMMSPDSRDKSLLILRAHPRFQADFMDNMPADIQSMDSIQQQRWLFGQAAVWPDLARGLSGADRRRYDHPNWHWIEGAWLRDEAIRHGNLYIDTQPHASIVGVGAAQIQRRSQAENIVNAIDLTLYQLGGTRSHQSAEDQALALSWFLHLTGDIHQPLHTGALVSERLFARGDRGGNDIQVRLSSAESADNLHAVWDGALRGASFGNTLQLLLDIAQDVAHDAQHGEYAPTRWLQESRDLLTSRVYTDAMISNVLRSEHTGNQPAITALDSNYEEDMRLIASQRIAEAGVRIATTLENL